MNDILTVSISELAVTLTEVPGGDEPEDRAEKLYTSRCLMFSHIPLTVIAVEWLEITINYSVKTHNSYFDIIH